MNGNGTVVIIHTYKGMGIANMEIRMFDDETKMNDHLKRVFRGWDVKQVGEITTVVGYY